MFLTLCNSSAEFKSNKAYIFTMFCLPFFKYFVFFYRDLTMEIVRYRLVGPLSNCVLNDALHPAPVHKVSLLL